MRIRVPLLVKILVPLVLLFVLTVTASGYRVYRESTLRFQAEMNTRLRRLATLVAASVPTDTLRTITSPADTNNAAYTEVENVLDQAVTAGNLAWMGIYYRDGNTLYYWVDYSETGVGYPFLYATPAHFAAYEDLQVHRVQYADEFGSYYGFVAPILVPGGDGEEVLGLVEAVIDGESSQLLERDTLERVLPFLIGGSLATILLTVLITTLVFNRPLQKLKQGALILGAGEFGHTIDLRSRDELGDLAETFNRMSTEIERLYRERVEAERRRREEEITRLQESERILEERVTERTFELVQRNKDLTQAQVELAAARDRAIAADRAKSEFVTFATHELKVPMTSIKGYAELLAAGKIGAVSQSQADILQSISAIVDRMATLVSDLSDVSRIESGMLRLNTRPLALLEAVNEVTLSARHQLDESGLRLSVQMADDLPLLQADRTRLVQILTNLISNAYKYTPPGGQITISAAPVPAAGDGRMVQVDVADTGIGIRTEDQDRIFEKFFRADDRRVTDVPGTGLGLNITRNLVKMQGGRIWFDSEYGHGTTFHFTLPCAQVSTPFGSAGQPS